MEEFYSRQQLAKRWNCSTRKIDRLRNLGLLPWLDLTAGLGKKPLVRLHLEDILAFEAKYLMKIKGIKEVVA